MSTTDWMAAELAHREAVGLRRSLRWITGAQEPWVTLGERRVLMLCSNNYLGLANHPAIIEAANRAARDGGFGAGASRLISGSMRAHRELEERLAAFKGTEAALLFNSGYHANVGVIAALVGDGDLVCSDALNHASIIDGCRLSRARLAVYPHADTAALDAALRTPARRKLVVTDSVFSMDGALAPLSEIAALAARHGAMLMIDEAHATGVLGDSGSGAVEQCGIADAVTVHMGTLGKALGGFGAFVAGSRRVIDFLVNTARTFIFTTALPPPIVAAAAAALTIVETEPERRARTLARARQLSRGLRQLGYRVPATDTPIVPVWIGEPSATMTLCERLLEAGVFVQGIRPPTVPPGTARLRATTMTTHSEADVDIALTAFAQRTTQPRAGLG
ncbi:MAG TPA: 8-amino-7-oxononanoate synthase [Candidatus Binatia bacterium]|nr:8-amino-7-oxononanoate synthase [Candidatus Binatia bacterium]